MLRRSRVEGRSQAYVKTMASADLHSAISFALFSGLNQIKIARLRKDHINDKAEEEGIRVPGGGVDDGEGDAIGVVVSREAGGGHDMRDVLRKGLGGDGNDEAGLARAPLPHHHHPHARPAKEAPSCCYRRATRHYDFATTGFFLSSFLTLPLSLLSTSCSPQRKEGSGGGKRTSVYKRPKWADALINQAKRPGREAWQAKADRRNGTGPYSNRIRICW